MEQRLSVVTLGVDDLARARAFYEKLGWRSVGDFDGVVFFQLRGMIVSLFPRTELAADANLEDAGAGGRRAFSGIALAHNVRLRADVDGVLKEAQQAGAEIVKPAADAFWGGYSGYFRDLDGHVWEVAWNPHWTLDGEGGVRVAP